MTPGRDAFAAPAEAGGTPSLIRFRERRSTSPYLSCVWYAETAHGGEFLSVTYSEWEIVIARIEGHVQVVLRGPESVVTRIPVEANGTWVGIRFRRGVTLPTVNIAALLNSRLMLPSVDGRFSLAGQIWEVPSFENAEDFVARLMRSGLIAFDQFVPLILQGETIKGESIRTQQRRFLRATGLSRQAIVSIERAHAATLMLRQGITIGDTIGTLGYADQPHLTRSMRRLIGCTPGEIVAEHTSQLSIIPMPDPAILEARQFGDAANLAPPPSTINTPRPR